jgi:hypothetical protein
MPTGFMWRGLSEAEAEAHSNLFIMALLDLQIIW